MRLDIGSDDGQKAKKRVHYCAILHGCNVFSSSEILLLAEQYLHDKQRCGYFAFLHLNIYLLSHIFSAREPSGTGVGGAALLVAS